MRRRWARAPEGSHFGSRLDAKGDGVAQAVFCNGCRAGAVGSPGTPIATV